MILLLIFSFLAGFVTILSPCILPILPIILSSTGGFLGKRRPLGVVVGFILSFTFFTLFLATIVSLSGISALALRNFSIVVIFVFGLSIAVPKINQVFESLFAKLSIFAPQSKGNGFFGGLIVGFSIGLLWTPCVGPILASVISLAISNAVNFQAFLITMAYSLGTAIPMFAIMIFGSKILQKTPWIYQNTSKIQRLFGVLMMITAVAIFFGADRQFQSFVLDAFPNYAKNLTKFEENSFQTIR